MPTYTDIARAAALLGVREVKPYITALETKVKDLEERLHLHIASWTHIKSHHQSIVSQNR
jgi:hypothetical protein